MAASSALARSAVLRAVLSNESDSIRCGLPAASVKKRPREAIQRTSPSRRRTRNSLWNEPAARLSVVKSRNSASISDGWMRSRIVVASRGAPSSRAGRSISSAKLSEWTKLLVWIVQSRIARPADSCASCSLSSLADSSASARCSRSSERTSATISRGSIGSARKASTRSSASGSAAASSLIRSAMRRMNVWPQATRMRRQASCAAASSPPMITTSGGHSGRDPGWRGSEIGHLRDLVPRLRDERGDTRTPL